MARSVKRLAYNVGDLGSIPGSGRSSGEGNGNPFHYSCLENPMDRENPGRLQSMGSQRVRHDLVTKQQQQYILKGIWGIGIMALFLVI